MFSATHEIHSPLSMDETFFMVNEAGFLLVSLYKWSEKHACINYSLEKEGNGGESLATTQQHFLPSFLLSSINL